MRIDAGISLQEVIAQAEFDSYWYMRVHERIDLAPDHVRWVEVKPGVRVLGPSTQTLTPGTYLVRVRVLADDNLWIFIEGPETMLTTKEQVDPHMQTVRFARATPPPEFMELRELRRLGGV